MDCSRLAESDSRGNIYDADEATLAVRMRVGHAGEAGRFKSVADWLTKGTELDEIGGVFGIIDHDYLTMTASRGSASQ